jgi:hypothetical protein
MQQNRRQVGSIFLLIAAVIGIVMLIVDWYRIPYALPNSDKIRWYTINLLSILLHTHVAPPGVMPRLITSVIYGEIGLFISGLVLFAILAGVGLLTRVSLRWLPTVTGIYVIAVGVFAFFESAWMGLNALDTPYIGIQPTVFHLLLVAQVLCVLIGSRLIARQSSPATRVPSSA